MTENNNWVGAGFCPIALLLEHKDNYFLAFPHRPLEVTTLLCEAKATYEGLRKDVQVGQPLLINGRSVPCTPEMLKARLERAMEIEAAKKYSMMNGDRNSVPVPSHFELKRSTFVAPTSKRLGDAYNQQYPTVLKTLLAEAAPNLLFANLRRHKLSPFHDHSWNKLFIKFQNEKNKDNSLTWRGYTKKVNLEDETLFYYEDDRPVLEIQTNEAFKKYLLHTRFFTYHRALAHMNFRGSYIVDREKPYKPAQSQQPLSQESAAPLLSQESASLSLSQENAAVPLSQEPQNEEQMMMMENRRQREEDEDDCPYTDMEAAIEAQFHILDEDDIYR